MTRPTTAPGLGAVLVVLHGGAALDRALAALDWVDARVVLDPGELATTAVLPPGVGHATTAAGALAATTAEWVVLLTDVEQVSPSLQTTLRASAAAGHAAALYRAYGIDAGRLTPRTATVRLGPRGGARIALDRRLEPLLATSARALTVAEPLAVAVPDDVADAAALLEGETRALSQLMWAQDRRPTVAAAAAAGLAAGWSMLGARGVGVAASQRWIAGVVAGYRAVLAHARLWELAYAAGAAA